MPCGADVDRHIQEAPHRHQDAYAVVVADSVDDIGQLNELLDSNLPVLLVRDLRQASRLMDGEETGQRRRGRRPSRSAIWRSGRMSSGRCGTAPRWS